MERRTNIEEAKEIFGSGIIGPDELIKYSKLMGIKIPDKIPNIPYGALELKELANDYLLVLGTSTMISGDPLSLHTLRAHFGCDSTKYEPCFYNQDWYIKEPFMDTQLSDTWYLIKKFVFEESRAKTPELLGDVHKLPSAIKCAYAFFLNYFCNGEYLWKHDFVWCNDEDHNGDRIYVGKYNDFTGINKNGFSIHRHLALRQWYGCIDTK